MKAKKIPQRALEARLNIEIVGGDDVTSHLEWILDPPDLASSGVFAREVARLTGRTIRDHLADIPGRTIAKLTLRFGFGTPDRVRE